MAAIPSPLVAPLRAAFTSQGFPAQTVRDDGSLNVAGLLAGIYDEVEFRSAATPTIRLNTQQLLTEGPPNPFMSWLRPTVVLRGKSGETVIAPVGASQGGSILPGLVVVGTLLGIGYAVGRATAR